jgi:hypothetical protein
MITRLAASLAFDLAAAAWLLWTLAVVAERLTGTG